MKTAYILIAIIKAVALVSCKVTRSNSIASSIGRTVSSNDQTSNHEASIMNTEAQTGGESTVAFNLPWSSFCIRESMAKDF